ncbi:hypothetical protein RYX36_003150 [Vicia faba]
MTVPQSVTREVSGNKAISNIVIVIAMQTEAQPVVNKFHLIQDPHSPFPQGVPWLRYHGKYKDININLIWPGKDPNSGVDSARLVASRTEELLLVMFSLYLTVLSMTEEYLFLFLICMELVHVKPSKHPTL